MSDYQGTPPPMDGKIIAGHQFDSHRRCGCGRSWFDIRNTAEADIEQDGIAHHGKLTRHEWMQIVAERDREDARIEAASLR